MDDRFRRILVPIDFSDDSQRALKLALRLARRDLASVLLLYVVESRVYASDLSMVAPSVPEEELVTRRAEDALDRLAERVISKEQSWTRRVTTGQPAARIVEVAEEEQADLIAMGTLGLTGLSHLLVGSTAEKVVRTAPCPVLTVRRGGAGD